MSAHIISTVGRAIDVIVAGRLVSHLRFAAGVCVLAAGLLMGSAWGAVAVADPDPSGSAAPGDGGANASGQGSATASSPIGNVTDTRRKTILRVTSTLGSGRQPGRQPSTGAKSPKKEPGGTDTADEKKDSGLAAAVPDLVAPVTNVVASVPNLVARVSDVIAPVPNVVAPVTNVVAPVTNVVAPVPNLVAPVSDVIAPVPNVVAPVTNVVAPVTNVVAPVPNVVASIPNLVAPVSDVIAPVQDMLTSVAGAVVPLTQLQFDLSSFLLGIAGVQPVVDGLGGIDGAGRSATADASVASQLRLVLLLSGVPGVPVAGNTGAATPGGVSASIFGAMSEAGRASSLPGMAPPAPNDAIPMGVRSFLRHALHDLPVAVSVAALAAVALPGVGGLVILTLAGVRIGYRQAKAGFVLQTAGIARFAGPGPLGVVRSGSLVVVRPRGLRVVRATGRAGRSAGSRPRSAGPTPPRTLLSRHSAPGSIAA